MAKYELEAPPWPGSPEVLIGRHRNRQRKMDQALRLQKTRKVVQTSDSARRAGATTRGEGRGSGERIEPLQLKRRPLALLGWSSESEPLSTFLPTTDSELEMSGSLYFCGILGADDPVEDDWMVTDIAVAAALVDDPTTIMHLFTTVPFREFTCCSPTGYYKFGDPGADRLEVPVPDDGVVVVNSNGSVLKDNFLQELSSINTRMKPADKLIVFIAAHGDEVDGAVLIAKQWLKASEVAGAIKNNATTILWSTACYAGKWLEGNVPWHGYVAAARNEESDSLTPSDSNYTRGGVSMLTTFTALAADQKANEPKEELSHSFNANTTADARTRRPLPVPQLTTEVLNRFRLVRQSPAAPTTTPKTNKSGSFRRVIQQLPPVPGLDLLELVESGTHLLDSVVSQAGLVFLSGRLQRPTFSEADLRILLSAFTHRRKCRAAIETYIDWVGWQTTRQPQWDFSGGGGPLELEMVAAADEEEVVAAAWREFFCWRPEGEGWRNLTWTDIRQQLALAWDAAERPQFSAADFLAVAKRVDDFRKENILASSPSLKTVVHHLAPKMYMTTSHSWPPYRMG
ncbi:hypothetical protein DFH09DRAFT_1274166 [Mycena vulgaris]|nr:hypothetical protein DFH09DRAFT_1274166 [Mycena vulgaris]